MFWVFPLQDFLISSSTSCFYLQCKQIFYKNGILKYSPVCLRLHLCLEEVRVDLSHVLEGCLIMEILRKKIEGLFDRKTAKNIISWLEDDTCDNALVLDLLDKDSEKLKELFGDILTFGTAGLRSLMGVGTNRLNVFTIRRATQGLAEVLKRRYPYEDISVVVGYDTRHHSSEFGFETAKVLAGNGIRAYLFRIPEPLALVSYSVRELQAKAGIMITASHNPPAYNGYKVYMSTGGQVLPPMDQEIVEEFQVVDFVRAVETVDHPLIHFIMEEMEDCYETTLHELQLCKEDNRQHGPLLRISYSPLHGTGVTMVPRILKSWGFSSVSLVEKQIVPDGDFPTVILPNPEDPEALVLGIQQMLEQQDDLFIATDPDSDRIGVVSLEEDGPYRFNGNQIACLLAAHILSQKAKQAPLGSEDKVVKSLVTTELLTAITEAYGGSVVNVGAGFKYIGEKIEMWRSGMERFIFGAEESYGYLYGSHVEDKDAMIAAALIAETALQQKLRGYTLRDALLELYEIYGYYANLTESIDLPIDQPNRKKELLDLWETQDPLCMSLSSCKLIAFENYKTGEGQDLVTGTMYRLTLPKMSMLCFYYEGGGRVIVRPSGTEPKIKLYFELKQSFPQASKERSVREEREKKSFEALKKFAEEAKSRLFYSGNSR